MKSLNDVLRGQQQTINILSKRVGELEEQVVLARATVRIVVREWRIDVPEKLDLSITEPPRRENWTDTFESFEEMRITLLEVTARLAKFIYMGVDQTEIIKETKKRFPALRGVPDSTLERRLRELRNPMELLDSPKDGYYFPTKKGVELLTGREQHG